MSSVKKAVMGLSGGMDSSTLLAYLLHQGYEVHACFFSYGSKHNVYEIQAMRKVVLYYNSIVALPDVIIHEMDLSDFMSNFKSDLLMSGGEIPEGHYEEESMRATVVPGRNLIFASIMAGLAESIEADLISLGVHSGDHHIYPDCRPDFINSLYSTIKLSTDNKVGVISPFNEFDKADILKLGFGYDDMVPYHLTRTCYKNQLYSCGKCGSCQERLEAFEKIGQEDPIRYEGQ